MNRKINPAKIRRRKIVKWICLLLFALICIVFERSLFTLRSHAPLLVFVTVLAVSLREGAKAGSVYALPCGLIYDALGGTTVYLSAFLFAVFAFFAGMLVTRYRHSLLLFLTTEAVFSALYLIGKLLYTAVATRTLLSLATYRALFLPPFLSTVSFGILVWLAVGGICACMGISDRNVYVRRRAERIH